MIWVYFKIHSSFTQSEGTLVRAVSLHRALVPCSHHRVSENPSFFCCFMCFCNLRNPGILSVSIGRSILHFSHLFFGLCSDWIITYRCCLLSTYTDLYWWQNLQVCKINEISNKAIKSAMKQIFQKLKAVGWRHMSDFRLYLKHADRLSLKDRHKVYVRHQNK